MGTSLKSKKSKAERNLKEFYRKIDKVNSKNFTKRQTETFLKEVARNNKWDAKTRRLLVPETKHSWGRGKQIAQGWLDTLSKVEGGKYLNIKGAKDLDKIKLVHKIVKNLNKKDLQKLRFFSSLDKKELNKLTVKQHNEYLKIRGGIKKVIVAHKIRVRRKIRQIKNKEEAFSFLIKELVTLLEKSD